MIPIERLLQPNMPIKPEYDTVSIQRNHPTKVLYLRDNNNTTTNTHSILENNSDSLPMLDTLSDYDSSADSNMPSFVIPSLRGDTRPILEILGQYSIFIICKLYCMFYTLLYMCNMLFVLCIPYKRILYLRVICTCLVQ